MILKDEKLATCYYGPFKVLHHIGVYPLVMCLRLLTSCFMCLDFELLWAPFIPFRHWLPL